MSNNYKKFKNPENFNNDKFPIPVNHKNECLNFSFKYLDLNNKKFKIPDNNNSYYEKLFERKKRLSEFTIKQLRNNHSDSLRFHSIDFKSKNVSENGFGINSLEDIDQNSYQFQISSNEHGRVHGFLIDTTFYIVWFDKDHKLYSSKK